MSAQRWRAIYRTTRRIHLLAGLVLGAFVVFYGASGLLLALASRLPDGRSHSQRTAPVPAAVAALFRDAAAGEGRGEASRASAGEGLREALGLRGQLHGVVKRADGRAALDYRRPGERVRVEVDRDARVATLRIDRFGWLETLVQLHRLHGAHGGPVYRLWSLAVDVVAIAAIGFSLTGVLLWFALHRDALGWIVLGVFTSYTLGSIAFLSWRM